MLLSPERHWRRDDGCLDQRHMLGSIPARWIAAIVDLTPSNACRAHNRLSSSIDDGELRKLPLLSVLPLRVCLLQCHWNLIKQSRFGPAALGSAGELVIRRQSTRPAPGRGGRWARRWWSCISALIGRYAAQSSFINRGSLNPALASRLVACRSSEVRGLLPATSNAPARLPVLPRPGQPYNSTILSSFVERVRLWPPDVGGRIWMRITSQAGEA